MCKYLRQHCMILMVSFYNQYKLRWFKVEFNELNPRMELDRTGEKFIMRRTNLQSIWKLQSRECAVQCSGHHSLQIIQTLFVDLKQNIEDLIRERERVSAPVTVQTVQFQIRYNIRKCSIHEVLLWRKLVTITQAPGNSFNIQQTCISIQNIIYLSKLHVQYLSFLFIFTLAFWWSEP